MEEFSKARKRKPSESVHCHAHEMGSRRAMWRWWCFGAARWLYIAGPCSALTKHRSTGRAAATTIDGPAAQVIVDLGRTSTGSSSGGTNPSAFRCHSPVNHDGGSAARSHSSHCASHALSISGGGQ